MTHRASGGLQGLRGEPRRFHEAGGGNAGARRHPLRAPPRRPELRTTLTAGRKIAAVHLSGERGGCGRAGKDRARPLPPRPAWPLGIPQNHAASRCRSLPRARSLFPRRSTPNRPAADMPLTVRLQSLLLEGEAMLAKHKHPDPYILPWRPGGTMYHRNPPPVPEVRADSFFCWLFNDRYILPLTTRCCGCRADVRTAGILAIKCDQLPRRLRGLTGRLVPGIVGQNAAQSQPQPGSQIAACEPR